MGIALAGARPKPESVSERYSTVSPGRYHGLIQRQQGAVADRLDGQRGFGLFPALPVPRDDLQPRLGGKLQVGGDQHLQRPCSLAASL